MRFQALGDTIITLPYLQSIKDTYPQVEIHFLTREEVCQIPKTMLMFDKVITISGGRNAKLQFMLAMLKIPLLWMQGYDGVIDLQNHRFSKIIRMLLAPIAWSEFDRDSPISAGERTKRTLQAFWKWDIHLATKIERKNPKYGMQLLSDHGYKEGEQLIVLNPAGFCESRSWPLENYVAFAMQWMQNVNPNSRFVLLLLSSQKTKAEFIKNRLGDRCIDLTGKANQLEAYDIISFCALVLSEDSGLMHMAWTQGIPTVALFSSSRKDWSAPQGEKSFCFDSSDMECGPCMLEKCKYGDNRCLTRYNAALVIEKARQLLS